MTEDIKNDLETASVPAFDAAEAMNTEGFAEFLGDFDDAETFDASDAEETKVRFEAFQNREAAAANMKSLFQNQLKGLNLGIEYGDDELEEHVGERMHELAYENPKRLNAIHNIVLEFHSTIQAIMETNKEIETLSKEADVGKTMEALKKKAELLGTAAESVEFVAGTGWVTGLLAAYEKFTYSNNVEFEREFIKSGKEYPKFTSKAEAEKFIQEHTKFARQHEARLAVKNEYHVSLDIDSIAAELEKTQKEIKDLAERAGELDASIANLDKSRAAAKDRFSQIRDALLAVMATNDGLREIAKKKALDKLEALKGTDPEKAEQFVDAISKVNDGNNPMKIDFFDGKEEEIRSEIEMKIEEKVEKDMSDIIAKTPLGSKAFDRMYEALVSEIKRPKVASYKGPAVRGFIVDALGSIAQKLNSTDKGKAVLVRFMAHRISKIK